MTLLDRITEQMKELTVENTKLEQELKEILHKRPPMTPAERREQVLNYCFSHLHKDSKITREQLAKIIFPYE